MLFDRPDIVRQQIESLVPMEKVGEPVGKFRAPAASLFHGIRKFGGMGGGESDQRRPSAASFDGDGICNGSVGIEKLSRCGISIGDCRKRRLLIGAAGRETA